MATILMNSKGCELMQHFNYDQENLDPVSGELIGPFAEDVDHAPSVSQGTMAKRRTDKGIASAA